MIDSDKSLEWVGDHDELPVFKSFTNLKINLNLIKKNRRMYKFE